MTATIPYNPYITTNAAGFFASVSDGFVQGVAMDDPSYRNWLAGGVLASAEVLPMWGGVGIYEDINSLNQPVAGSTNPLGGIVGRATNVTVGAAFQLSGFSVFNQAHAAIITTSSQVPLVASGGPVNFFRLGSRARIPVALSPALVATLTGASILGQVSWDYVNQQLVQYAPAYAANTITGATWANTSGGQITYTVSTTPVGVLVAGDSINVSGVISTGGTGVGYNGTFIVVSVTSTTIVVTFAAAASPGTYSSGGTVLAGGGALPCKVLQVQSSNCKTVAYTASPQAANWNNNGACALIEI